MAMLKKILAPTDFSELSREGVRYASQLAKDVGAQLIVMNVIILDETNTTTKGETEAHKARLAEFVAKTVPHHGADLKVREVVVAGQPYNAIIDCAANEHVDLVVMSSHGRSGLSRMLIGSVTDRLLRAAKCPVLVVPSHGEK
jgi:universal stress protein A